MKGHEQHEIETDDTYLEEKDLETIIQAERLQTLRRSVRDLIDKPDHPVLVDNLDLCEMYQAGKLEALKVAHLRKLCTALQLEVHGSKFRGRTYIDPLEQFLLTCSCRN